MGWAAIWIVPLWVWIYLVAQPLTTTDPLNWRLLFSGTVDNGHFGRGGGGFLFYFYLVGFLPIILLQPIITIFNILRNFVRFKQLPAQVRAAVARLASASVTPKDSAGTMPSNAAAPTKEVVSIVSDYQPLNKRPPTREILSPFASHFEALLALPGMLMIKIVVGPRTSRACTSSTHNP